MSSQDWMDHAKAMEARGLELLISVSPAEIEQLRTTYQGRSIMEWRRWFWMHQEVAAVYAAAFPGLCESPKFVELGPELKWAAAEVAFQSSAFCTAIADLAEAAPIYGSAVLDCWKKLLEMRDRTELGAQWRWPRVAPSPFVDDAPDDPSWP